MSTEIRIHALAGLPEVEPGDELATLIADAAEAADTTLTPGTILCVAQKLVSKSLGLVVELASVTPSERALALAEELGRNDPRLIEVILGETAEVIRAEHGVLICRTHSGLVCAHAGVDLSNSGGRDRAVLLPPDPDSAARRLRMQLHAAMPDTFPLGVVICDSFSRPWRTGQVDVAIGGAGIALHTSPQGSDRDGRPLAASIPASADELAAAAGLARRKDGADGVVIVEGAPQLVTDGDGPGTAALVRAPERDLFR